MGFYEIRVVANFAVTYRRKRFRKYINGCAVTGFYTTEYVKSDDLESAKNIAVKKTRAWLELLIDDMDLKSVARKIHSIAYDESLYTSKSIHDNSEISKIQITNVEAKRVNELFASEAIKHFTVTEIAEEVDKILKATV